MKNKLLPCPICGKQPTLNTLDPEYQSKKYFCGVHVSCGDWAKTKELAITSWNERVKEYKDKLQSPKEKSRDELEQELTELKEHLKRLEWSGAYYVDSGYCPVCRNKQSDGQHEPDCWLGNAIKGVNTND